MKKLFLLGAGTLYACMAAAQPSFQTSLEAGMALPLNSHQLNGTHAGDAVQVGNHLDLDFGTGSWRFGLGAYIGYLNSLGADNSYKETGAAIADRVRFPATGLVFNSSSFKSAQLLLGPIASIGTGSWTLHLWAKGGYGINEPSRYAVLYRENGVSNNIYVNQAGEHKNGLAYNAGAGVRYALSDYVGLQLSASYFGTQTDQVNYNFDREKGLSPKYYTASNQFIQANAGLHFSIGNAGRNKTVLNRADHRSIADTGMPVAKGQKIKTKSNIKNDRLLNNAGNDTGDNPYNDSLFFSPEKIELRAGVSDFGMNRVQLRSVDNYLTGFVYQTANGAMVSQCGSNAMPGEPIPGIDVRLRRADAAAGTAVTTRTNPDGSFAFNNILPGNYRAEAGTSAMDVMVKGSKEEVFKILDIYDGSCRATKENFVLNTDDKTYVEVVNARPGDSSAARKHIANIKWSDARISGPRDAGSRMATGRRMHKPYRVADTEFELNMDNIVRSDGKLYAEVITSREASSGMASGRRTLITGDIDGDGVAEQEVVSPRDHASGLPTGKRMHKPMVITMEMDRRAGLDIDSDNDEMSDRDAASGMATGRRMHKPFVVTKEIKLTEAGANQIVSPRDAASGMPTGRRMHKPFVITMNASEPDNDIVSPRDAASGMPTGRRQYQPIVVRIDPEENTYQIVSPLDAASGLPTGKRMHKPFVITKEIGYTEDGGETTSFKLVWGDPHVDSYAGRDAASGMATGKRVATATGSDGQEGAGDAQQDVVTNPLYEGSGTGGVNPLHQSNNALHVTGGNGKGHDIFIPSRLVMAEPVSSPVAEYSTYNLEQVAWIAPEAANERKGWDGSVKGGRSITGIAPAGKGITEKGIKRTEASERKGWDGTVKGGMTVKEISRINCEAGTCTMDALVEIDGQTFEAVIAGVLKTKHDTAKNSVGNIR